MCCPRLVNQATSAENEKGQPCPNCELSHPSGEEDIRGIPDEPVEGQGLGKMNPA